MTAGGNARKRNILIVYAHVIYPMRATIAQLLRAFPDYSEDNVYLLNLVHRRVPWYVRSVDFDLIVFHTLFMTAVWGGPNHFRMMMRRALPLRQLRAVKAMMPQDEFMYSDLLCEFARALDIDWVFTCAPESEWSKLYASVDAKKVKFLRVLPGYLDEKQLPAIVHSGRPLNERAIDVSYRLAAKPRFVWGRQGLLKQRIAEVFQEKAPQRGLKVDISTRSEDTILGDEWYRFLGNCKYTLGVESGASLIDRDASIEHAVNAYVAQHPQADFFEVEAACFPHMDGNVNLVAISPRHLEACATRTCQVLTEGEYNGILQPWRHYVPLKRDFSNIDEVLDIVARDDLRQGIVERAFTDVVESGQFTYGRFVEHVVQQSLGPRVQGARPLWLACWCWVVRTWMRWADDAEWWLIKWVLAPGVRPIRWRLRITARVRAARKCLAAAITRINPNRNIAREER